MKAARQIRVGDLSKRGSGSVQSPGRGLKSSESKETDRPGKSNMKTTVTPPSQLSPSAAAKNLLPALPRKEGQLAGAECAIVLPSSPHSHLIRASSSSLTEKRHSPVLLQASSSDTISRSAGRKAPPPKSEDCPSPARFSSVQKAAALAEKEKKSAHESETRISCEEEEEVFDSLPYPLPSYASASPCPLENPPIPLDAGTQAVESHQSPEDPSHPSPHHTAAPEVHAPPPAEGETFYTPRGGTMGSDALQAQMGVGAGPQGPAETGDRENQGCSRCSEERMTSERGMGSFRQRSPYFSNLIPQKGSKVFYDSGTLRGAPSSVPSSPCRMSLRSGRVRGGGGSPRGRQSQRLSEAVREVYDERQLRLQQRCVELQRRVGTAEARTRKTQRQLSRQIAAIMTEEHARRTTLRSLMAARLMGCVLRAATKRKLSAAVRVWTAEDLGQWEAKNDREHPRSSVGVSEAEFHTAAASQGDGQIATDWTECDTTSCAVLPSEVRGPPPATVASSRLSPERRPQGGHERERERERSRLVLSASESADEVLQAPPLRSSASSVSPERRSKATQGRERHPIIMRTHAGQPQTTEGVPFFSSGPLGTGIRTGKRAEGGYEETFTPSSPLPPSFPPEGKKSPPSPPYVLSSPSRANRLRGSASVASPVPIRGGARTLPSSVQTQRGYAAVALSAHAFRSRRSPALSARTPPQCKGASMVPHSVSAPNTSRRERERGHSNPPPGPETVKGPRKGPPSIGDYLEKRKLREAARTGESVSPPCPSPPRPACPAPDLLVSHGESLSRYCSEDIARVLARRREIFSSLASARERAEAEKRSALCIHLQERELAKAEKLIIGGGVVSEFGLVSDADCVPSMGRGIPPRTSPERRSEGRELEGVTRAFSGSPPVSVTVTPPPQNSSLLPERGCRVITTSLSRLPDCLLRLCLSRLSSAWALLSGWAREGGSHSESPPVNRVVLGGARRPLSAVARDQKGPSRHSKADVGLCVSPDSNGPSSPWQSVPFSSTGVSPEVSERGDGDGSRKGGERGSEGGMDTESAAGCLDNPLATFSFAGRENNSDADGERREGRGVREVSPPPGRIAEQPPRGDCPSLRPTLGGSSADPLPSDDALAALLQEAVRSARGMPDSPWGGGTERVPSSNTVIPGSFNRDQRGPSPFFSLSPTRIERHLMGVVPSGTLEASVAATRENVEGGGTPSLAVAALNTFARMHGMGVALGSRERRERERDSLLFRNASVSPPVSEKRDKRTLLTTRSCSSVYVKSSGGVPADALPARTLSAASPSRGLDARRGALRASVKTSGVQSPPFEGSAAPQLSPSPSRPGLRGTNCNLASVDPQKPQASPPRQRAAQSPSRCTGPAPSLSGRGGVESEPRLGLEESLSNSQVMGYSPHLRFGSDCPENGFATHGGRQREASQLERGHGIVARGAVRSRSRLLDTDRENGSGGAVAAAAKRARPLVPVDSSLSFSPPLFQSHNFAESPVEPCFLEPPLFHPPSLGGMLASVEDQKGRRTGKGGRQNPPIRQAVSTSAVGGGVGAPIRVSRRAPVGVGSGLARQGGGHLRPGGEFLSRSLDLQEHEEGGGGRRAQVGGMMGGSRIIPEKTWWNQQIGAALFASPQRRPTVSSSVEVCLFESESPPSSVKARRRGTRELAASDGCPVDAEAQRHTYPLSTLANSRGKMPLMAALQSGSPRTRNDLDSTGPGPGLLPPARPPSPFPLSALLSDRASAALFSSPRPLSPSSRRAATTLREKGRQK
uniref:Uncharacterized protein n=1 Tax=Chromera velia CCMP2878 TaxID=1169474 RepID=A0A0G4I1N0_9ALVE|eukprot:Cvel_1667.t1-p1 / transcript=Cvel_1667.t1 / gene=Cvel_1667 / organism=Chromera_velia_CCMP2878 / gene_product=hypothetical protein / transcript_product=hypothetical protein / location=Cvel_scaffold60:19462-25205(+) / protein_length=1757 / sequence_SO=supercontig / SO=protein_coding / is_pseudo=false